MPQPADEALAISGDRKQRQLQPEQEDEQHAQPECRHRHERDKNGLYYEIHEAASLHRRHSGERHRDDDGEECGIGDESERRPQPLDDRQRHRAALHDGLAERAAKHISEKCEVLLPKRSSEAKLMPQELDIRLRAPRADQERGRVSRQDSEKHEGDERDARRPLDARG